MKQYVTCSKKQSQKLIGLGVDGRSEYSWVVTQDDGKMELIANGHPDITFYDDRIPAYTLRDLHVLLPRMERYRLWNALSAEGAAEILIELLEKDILRLGDLILA